MSIHPTAIIDPQARLHSSVRVGPYAVIGPEVEIGEETEVGAHAIIEGPIRIGRRNRIFPHASVGLIPQDLKFKGERSEVIIGDDNRIREFVTLHRGTEGGGAVTRLGNDNLIMAYSHVAHDCQIGDHCILGNAATLAGHVVIEDWAIVGAFCGVHQFCRIGRHAYIGACTVITQDVPPFSLVVTGRETKCFGVNAIGLERRGFTPERIGAIEHAFRLLLRSKLNTTQAIAEIRTALNGSADVQQLVEFLESSRSSGRGLTK